MTQRIDTDTIVCESLEAALNLFLDGEMPIDEQPELYTHLAGCASCRRYLDSMLFVRRAIRDEHLTVPPIVDETFFERLAAHKEVVSHAHHRLERRARRREQLPVVGRVVTLAMLVVIIVGGVVSGTLDAGDTSAAVIGEEELVNFPIENRTVREPSAVYVFYPGLTVEAENWVEPASLEPL